MDTNKPNRSQSKKPKKSIESDLLLRHQKLKTKLTKQKTKQIQETEGKTIQQSPKINSKSYRLASKSQPDLIVTSSRIQRTHEILKSSKMLPKKVKVSLNSLKMPSPPSCIFPSKYIKYDEIFTSTLPAEKVTFPSIEQLFDHENSQVPLPADISKRNDLILSLKTEPLVEELPEQSEVLPSFEERSTVWLKKKDEKIQNLKEKNETLATECCTFRPTLISTNHSKINSPRGASVNTLATNQKFISNLNSAKSYKFDRFASNEPLPSEQVNKQLSLIIDKSSGYSSMTPYSLDISYHNGYSHKMKRKFKTLISYNVLNIRPYETGKNNF